MGIRVFLTWITMNGSRINHQLFFWWTILIHENSWVIRGHSCSKKKHMRCFLGNEQRMHITICRVKLVWFVQFVFKKKRIYICVISWETNNECPFIFSEHGFHGFHEFRHCNAVSIKQLTYLYNHVDNKKSTDTDFLFCVRSWIHVYRVSQVSNSHINSRIKYV